MNNINWFRFAVLLVLFMSFYYLGKTVGKKEEREATQNLWYTWFCGVRSYTLNQFAGALTDGEHWLPSDERVKTSRYLDVTKPRDK